jgi:hypothetical protein
MNNLADIACNSPETHSAAANFQSNGKYVPGNTAALIVFLAAAIQQQAAINTALTNVVKSYCSEDAIAQRRFRWRGSWSHLKCWIHSRDLLRNDRLERITARNAGYDLENSVARNK